MAFNLPFRIGTTSYILEDTLAANAGYLAAQVGEMELVLFDLESGLSNLPNSEMQKALREIAEDSGLVYTVHLPLDLSLRDEGRSLTLAKKVLDFTQALPVDGMIAHIEGWYWEDYDSSCGHPDLYKAWVDEGRQLARWLYDQVPRNWNVCIENTEGFPANELGNLTQGLSVHQCIDVGHLLKEKHSDPLGYINRHLPECRIMHLHGLDADGRDHQSISLLPETFLDQLLTMLVGHGYDGVLTMEVFGMIDFATSLQAVKDSLAGIGVWWED